MTRAPYVMLKSGTRWSREVPAVADSTLGWRFVNPRMKADWTISLGLTAEKVAKQYGITRDGAGRVCARKPAAGGSRHSRRVFCDEIVPVEVRQKGQAPCVVAADEHPRPGCLPRRAGRAGARYSPPTARSSPGNSSGINDGASALLCRRPSQTPRVRSHASWPVPWRVSILRSWVSGRCPPPERRSNARGSASDQIDLIELNEAFASQAIACMRDLELDPARVNVTAGRSRSDMPSGRPDRGC